MTDGRADALISATWMVPIVNIVLGMIGLSAMMVCRKRVSRTTLLAAWNWAALSLCVVTAVEVAAAWSALAASGWVPHWRYAAAVTTLAPQMAVLGAKRPQHRAWQFIVASLLIVLLLPSAGSLLRPGGAPYTDGPWRWFLTALLLVGWGNYAVTRRWPSSFLFAAGQCCLLGEHLPWPFSAMAVAEPTSGLAFFAVAAWLVALDIPRPRPSQVPLERVWLDFRDQLGAMWSMRVAERFNAAARMHDWPLRLTWRGVTWSDGINPPVSDVAPAAVRNLRMLLRRFVSPEWIAARLGVDNSVRDEESPGSS